MDVWGKVFQAEGTGSEKPESQRQLGTGKELKGSCGSWKGMKQTESDEVSSKKQVEVEPGFSVGQAFAPGV